MFDEYVGDAYLLFVILQHPYFTWSSAVTLKMMETMF